MTQINIPTELPKCKLLEQLAKKIAERNDTNFNFFGELDSFRKRVSEEV